MGKCELGGGGVIWYWALERGDSWVGAGLKELAGSMVMRTCRWGLQQVTQVSWWMLACAIYEIHGDAYLGGAKQTNRVEGKARLWKRSLDYGSYHC
jgi:hypothetical protein